MERKGFADQRLLHLELRNARSDLDLLAGEEK